MLWCALYVAMGVAVEDGWSWVARLFGVDGAVIVLLAVVGLGFLVRRSVLRARERKRRV